MITVAFDLEHERQSNAGVARCSRSLLAELGKHEEVNLISLGGGRELQRDTFAKRITTLRQDLIWYPFAGRRAADKRGADVYHCPTPRAPLWRGTPPLVVTVHDLVSFRFPQTLTPWTRLYEQATLPHVVRAADRVIAVSEDTAADLQTILRTPAAKIRVVPHGIEPSLFEPSTTERPFPFPYVLFVGTPQPRKNLPRLAAAMDMLRARGHALRLVVAGAAGWGRNDLDQSTITFAGSVSDEQLRALYRHAECLALVSLHEGFGMPAVEAMAVGTPVVASRAGALPEVTAGAAILVDPHDRESIASGILEAIHRRAELVVAGRLRAKNFSWQKSAELTVDVYRELA